MFEPGQVAIQVHHTKNVLMFRILVRNFPNYVLSQGNMVREANRNARPFIHEHGK